MMQISNSLYAEMLNRLCEAIDGRDYLSELVAFETEDMECLLTIAVVVYRHRVSYPEGDTDEIQDLIPIWWEFHTFKDNDECLNDFKFSEMKKYLT